MLDQLVFAEKLGLWMAESGDDVPAPATVAERVEGRAHPGDVRGLVVRRVEGRDDPDVLRDREQSHREQRGVVFRRLMPRPLGGPLVTGPGVRDEQGVEAGVLGRPRHVEEHAAVQWRRRLGGLVRPDMVGLARREEVAEAELAVAWLPWFHRKFLSQATS